MQFPKMGHMQMKTIGAAGAMLFMQQMGTELFDLINKHKSFRIDVSYNPETDSTVFDITEFAEDGTPVESEWMKYHNPLE